MPPAQDGESRERRAEIESCIAEALVELKGLPFCNQSYPGLWEWTKEVCAEAFGRRGKEKTPHPPECGGVVEQSLGSVAIVPLASGAEMDVDAPTNPVSTDQSHDQKQDAYISLLQLCLYGTAICATRYPAFFKPLYRMATTLHTIGLVSVRIDICSFLSLIISLHPPPPSVPENCF